MSILNIAKSANQRGSDNINPKFLFFGEPGSGKTHLSTKDGKPLVLLLESNGLTTIADSNPDTPVIIIEDIGMVYDVFDLARNGELRKQGFDRIVIDSLTELQRFIKEDVRHAGIAEAKRSGNKAINPDLFSQQQWGFLGNRMQRFMRDLRAVPFPIVCTALCETMEVTVGGQRAYQQRPAFDGRKTAGEVAQFFNAIGYCMKRQEGKATEHIVVFDGPREYMTKSCRSLRGIHNTHDVTGWMSLITKVNESDGSTPPDGQ